MTCHEAREYVFAFLDNELEASLSMEFQHHIDHCAACAREVEIEHTIRDRLVGALQPQTPEAPLPIQIIDPVLTQDGISWRHRRRTVLAACAAMVLVVTSFTYVVIQRGHGNQAYAGFIPLVVMDWPAAYTPNTGPMDAFVLVQLKGKPGMPGTFAYVDRLRSKLNQVFPGVEFAFDTGGMMTAALNFGQPSQIHVRVQGSNLFTAEEIAGYVQRVASSVPGATDVRIAQRMDYPQIDIRVDRVKAAQLGVTQEDVVKNVVTTVNSSINFDPVFWIDEWNGNHYSFGVQYAEQDINSIETLKDVPITGEKSTLPVTLRNIAKFGRKTGPAVVNHLNITRTIDVFANVATGYDVGGVARALEKRLETSVLKPVRKEMPRGVVYEVDGDYAGKGYSYAMSGEVETMRSSFVQFGQGLLIAVILVYLTMVAQLRSFGIPFVILLTIPLGFIGVGSALWVTHTNLSIPAFMGIIMMTGIVVEYSIILLDFANRRVQEGLSVRQAIIEASWIRLRPILMTSLTTWPATLEAYEQADLYAKISGYVAKVNVDIGSTVQAGDVLMELAVPEMADELRQREAVVEAKQTREKLEALTAQRQEQLAAEKAVSPQALDEAMNQWAIAKADSRVAEANAARLRTLLGYATLTAPFAGRITARHVDPGAFVRSAADGPSSALFTLAKTDKIRLVIQVPETDAPHVESGTAATIKLPALDDTMQATVTRTAMALNVATRTMRAEVDDGQPL